MSTIGPEERERIILKTRQESKEKLIQYYTHRFANAHNELNKAISENDVEGFGKAFSELNFCNMMLKQIEA
jgi:hypothetical protein